MQECKVLLADDNLLTQLATSEILNSAGFIVTVINNGKECLEKIHEDTFDLVLMDIHMPYMNGLEVTRLIRGLSVNNQIPIIALTAACKKSEMEEGYAAGINA